MLTIKAVKTEKTEKLAHDLNLLGTTAVLLYSRGLTDASSAKRFLMKETEYFHNSFLITDMDIAVKRIIEAVENYDKIVIYGDYDVDGVTSVSALYLYLKSKAANVEYYIPNRVGEGYGINENAVLSLAASGANLMITVDTGITAVKETELANSLGIDVIITDHHECHQELPNAFAVVNPRRNGCLYPFKELAGVGVVFKLLCALEQTYGNADFIRCICDNYGDMVAIGTVADVMPLVDENRLIVSIGLRMITDTERLGLAALIAKSETSKKRRITSSLIGYVIAPRINAAGRISSASRAVELFLTESAEEANIIAAELCDTNKERQAEENRIVEQAYKKIDDEHDFKHDLVIVLADDNWHHGIIGIVSSRITEKYNLPSILISFEGDNGDIGKGSGRSIKGMNLVEGLMSCDDCLIKYGGHELAAGLSIERSKLQEFKKRINAYAAEHLTKCDLQTSVSVDCELDMSEINMRLANELYLLEPYGISNPVPVFILKNVNLAEITSIGNNRHIRLIVEKDNITLTAIYFGISMSEFDYCVGDEADIVFNLDINDFQNVQTVQLVVRSIFRSMKYINALDAQKEIYSEMKDGTYNDDSVVPLRSDFAEVYLYLKHEVRAEREVVSVHSIERKLGGVNNEYYVKIRFIIDILNEMNIIGAERLNDDDIYRFKINYIKNKINLDKSSIYKRLKSRAGRQEKG